MDVNEIIDKQLANFTAEEQRNLAAANQCAGAKLALEQLKATLAAQTADDSAPEPTD